jgi:hypothetical protein
MLLSHVVFAWNVWCMTYGATVDSSLEHPAPAQGTGA